MTTNRNKMGEAFEKLLKAMDLNIPMSVNQIAEESGISWPTTKNALNVILDIQDFLSAYEFILIEGRPRKIVLAQIRVSMIKLPSEVRDWFIDSAYFTNPRKQYTTEEAHKIIAPEGKNGKTPFDVAIRRVVDALKLEDELSVLELSKRTVLNRRTVERVLALLIQFQDKISEFMIVELEESGYVKELRPSLYDLDSKRMIYLLKKRYIPGEAKAISKKQERELFRMH